MIPNQKEFVFVPLGGCGEIGMNLNLFGHAGKWLMVDCGITFEKDESSAATGNRVEMPDPSFISNRSEALVGIIATHAHEDHIGAIAHLWDQFQCPIYTTPFTRNVLLRKLRQKGIAPNTLKGRRLSNRGKQVQTFARARFARNGSHRPASTAARGRLCARARLTG